MNTMTYTVPSPRHGRAVPPASLAAEAETENKANRLPALDDNNVSDVFRRARVIQSERDRLRAAPLFGAQIHAAEPAGADFLEPVFFEWALGKVH